MLCGSGTHTRLPRALPQPAARRSHPQPRRPIGCGTRHAVNSRPCGPVASVVLRLQGHTSGVRAAMFTQHRPNVIVSGAADKTLR